MDIPEAITKSLLLAVFDGGGACLRFLVSPLSMNPSTRHGSHVIHTCGSFK